MNTNLSTELKEKARELGFVAVGVGPASPLEFAEKALDERCQSGMLAGYGFIGRHSDYFTRPERLLTGAKSVVSVAWSYVGLSDDPIYDHFARFACGRDYHVVIEEKLNELGDWLKDKFDANYRVCVDTSPILDRAAAQRAGIGSYGKNCTIITKHAGSLVVLGEMITDIELEFDEPAPMDACGECSECIKACPAGAIVRPFVVDQTKCISHLTQMKGELPVDLRPLLGHRVYGCDTCQEVCPKNKLSLQGKKRSPSFSLELAALLNISQEDYDDLIATTAAGWIGRSRLRRNVAVVLGNIGDRKAIPALQEALTDSDLLVRMHAAWAINQIMTG